MLAIENVLSPSIRNLFSVFLKMDVGVTNGSSSPLLKMNAFHSFKKRLSENILLPRVGGRQHRTACQLWKRNEAWKQTECRTARWGSAHRTGASHEATAQDGSWDPQVGWEMAQPLLTTPLCSIPGLCVAVCPGTASMTHGKPRQHELAKVHTSQPWFYACSCVTLGYTGRCRTKQPGMAQNQFSNSFWTAWTGAVVLCQRSNLHHCSTLLLSTY